MKRDKGKEEMERKGLGKREMGEVYGEVRGK